MKPGTDNQQGQVLVQVALAMVVLLGFVALAIDVGNAYAERRRMQNAADAGALAGAREICFGTPSMAEEKAREYAITRNGAGEGTLVTVLGGWRVNVVARTAADTFVARVLGVDVINVSAEAEATCGKAISACGLWPIAYDVTRWNADRSCGAKRVVWSSGMPDAAYCEDYDCDLDGDGEDDVFPPDDRTWVDFSAAIADGANDLCDSSGCGSDELRYRIRGYDNRNNTCGSWIEIPSCLGPAAGGGNQGGVSSGWLLAQNEISRIIRFPLYQLGGSCTLPPDAVPCGTERFPVVDFGCGQIIEVSRLCRKGGGPCNGYQYILVEIPCVNGQIHPECSSDCGTTLGGVPLPGDVRAVSLTK